MVVMFDRKSIGVLMVQDAGALELPSAAFLDTRLFPSFTLAAK